MERAKELVRQIADMVSNHRSTEWTSDEWAEACAELRYLHSIVIDEAVKAEQAYELKKLELLKEAKNAEVGKAEAKTTKEYLRYKNLEGFVKTMENLAWSANSFARNNDILH